MILDIILVAFATILVIAGIRRGIARTILNVASVAVSGVLAYFGSKLLSSWIYTQFISQSVTQSVSETVEGSAQNAQIISQEAVDQLPEFIKILLKGLGITCDSIAGSAYEAANNNADSIAQTVDNSIAPVVISVLSAVLLVVLFIVFMFVCKLISRKLALIFELPVINSINRLLGGALGLVEGVAICYLAILVCRIILPLSADPIITPEMIDTSVIFKTVYYSDFMNAFALVLGSSHDADTLVEQATQAASTAQ
ncbi:MAG: CvpA family protein [Ruminococcus sp.]|nr:CvpA family protein [Ruminococcus sp.]